MKFVLIMSVLLFIIILWFYIDFKLGQKRHFSCAAPKETGILYGQFDIFVHGKELFYDYFAEIRKAQHHVHILFYIVKDDRFSQDFLRLLMDKALEGVEVRLLLDRVGSWKISKKLVLELEEAGVQVSFSDKIQLPFLFYSSQVRNHRKVTVIDGKIGYLGGYNIGKEYIDEKPKLSPWRDYHLKITGEGVNFLQSEFFSDWQRSTNKGLSMIGAGADPQVVLDPTTLDSSQRAELSAYYPKLKKETIRHQFVPTEAGQLEERFITLLKKAEQKIFIGTPYFIPSQRLFSELMSAAMRGVRITIMVPYTADHALVQEASFPYLRRLLKAGASVYQYRNGFYHAKTLIIDDIICDIGTANFDKRSLYLNKEMNCYLYDPVFIARMNDVLTKDFQDSVPLTLETLTKFNPARTLKELIAGALSYFL
ncbi:cardiolipin synthase [Bacillus sp. BRMEA1]|uniref:cardiolipin synthase n=1 Tax=Neobacillus endophyticus TaxID=2738405 RepID=UPI00156781F8|nr:cardiolipin synthase [Neobacillus endophyticus]NRD77219.1 cardiolipin synthase [Neobacillus endophyticus]